MGKINDRTWMGDRIGMGDNNLPSAYQHPDDIKARRALAIARNKQRDHDERRVPAGRVYQVISDTRGEPEVGDAYPMGNSAIVYNPKTKLWEYATSLAVQQPMAVTARLVRNNPYKK
jgi:hypothetical protein